MQQIEIKPQNYQLITSAIETAMKAGSFELVIRKHDDSLKAKQRVLANIWYGQIAKQQGTSAGAAEAYCKYRFGLKLASINYPGS